MRQVFRWYDMNILYEGEVKGHFGGTISRQSSAEKLLEKLEMTGNVHFEIGAEQLW